MTSPNTLICALLLDDIDPLARNRVVISDFNGAFSDIAFAITDWSPERKTLGPFRDVFCN